MHQFQLMSTYHLFLILFMNKSRDVSLSIVESRGDDLKITSSHGIFFNGKKKILGSFLCLFDID